MALRLTTPAPDPTGADVRGAYARVAEITLCIAQARADAVLFVYRSQAARDAGKAPLEQRPLRVADTADATPFTDLYSQVLAGTANPVKLVYGYLKALPEYASAEDV